MEVELWVSQIITRAQKSDSARYGLKINWSRGMLQLQCKLLSSESQNDFDFGILDANVKAVAVAAGN